MEEPPPPPETKIMSMKYLDPDGEKSEFYRTKPCKFFFERGLCLKGDMCNYSHDPELYEEFLKEQEYYSESDDEYVSDSSVEEEGEDDSEDEYETITNIKYKEEDNGIKHNEISKGKRVIKE